MSGVIAEIIARFGEKIRLYNARDSIEIVGILQPLRQRGREQIQDQWFDLGGMTPGRFLLLCVQSPEGYDMVERDGTHYWLRRWEAYRAGGRVLYHWAVLTKENDNGSDL